MPFFAVTPENSLVIMAGFLMAGLLTTGITGETLMYLMLLGVGLFAVIGIQIYDCIEITQLGAGVCHTSIDLLNDMAYVLAILTIIYWLTYFPRYVFKKTLRFSVHE